MIEEFPSESHHTRLDRAILKAYAIHIAFRSIEYEEFSPSELPRCTMVVPMAKDYILRPNFQSGLPMAVVLIQYGVLKVPHNWRNPVPKSNIIVVAHILYWIFPPE